MNVSNNLENLELSHAQSKRLKKVNRDKFYLIDKINKKTHVSWKITGSTFNIYDVDYNISNKTLSCSCPDSMSWAKRENCYCNIVVL